MQRFERESVLAESENHRSDAPFENRAARKTERGAGGGVLNFVTDRNRWKCGRDRQNARSRDHETKGCTPGSLDEARYRWPNCFEERKNAEAEERLRRRYLLSGNAERKLALMTIVTGCNKSVRRAAVALVTRIPLRSHRDADYHMLLSLRFKGAVSLLRSFRRSGDLNFSINKITGDRVRSGSDKRKMES